MIDPDGMDAEEASIADQDKPKPKPVQLKEVHVTAPRILQTVATIFSGVALRTGAQWGYFGADPEPVTKIGLGIATALYTGYVLYNEIDKYQKSHSVNSNKTVEDLESESVPIKIKNQKKNEFYKKQGSMKDADQDFDDLGAQVEGHTPEKQGRFGRLPDGRKINVRNGSSTPGDSPTLEIKNPDGSTKKWRYEK